MKSLKKLFILLILLIPGLVHADMGAPGLRPYDIVVVNADGVNYYDYNGTVIGHLNKDEVVSVDFEYDNSYIINLKNNTTGYIYSLDGFMIVEEEVNPSKIENDSNIIKTNKAKALVNNKNGLDILSGPSKLYKKVGHIDYKTSITYDYAIDGGGNITYIYVTYKGVSGWLDILDENVLIENNVKYIFKDDTVTTCGTIPKNTITTPNYKTDMWSRKALFEYNNCSVLLSTSSENIITLYGEYSNYKTLKNFNFYKEGNTSSEVIKTIPSGSTIVILGSVNSMEDTPIAKYVYFDGTYGWIFASYNEIDFIAKTDTDITINDTVEVTNEEINEEAETSDNLDDISTNDKINPFSLIIICALSAVIISLTAVVIVLLVNKNNKKSK